MELGRSQDERESLERHIEALRRRHCVVHRDGPGISIKTPDGAAFSALRPGDEINRDKVWEAVWAAADYIHMDASEAQPGLKGRNA